MSQVVGPPDPGLELIHTRLARRKRLGRVEAWGSLGPVQDFAATAIAGFDPVGHVLGSAVHHFGYVVGNGRCTGTWTYQSRTDHASLNGPYRALLRSLYGARRLALARAVEECVALGADGIIGARVSISPFSAGGIEFSVQGTAVRAKSRVRPAQPFTTHVSAQEFTRLLTAGWMPFALLFGIAISSRHDGRDTWDQTRRRLGTTGNREVRGFSQLVNDARRDARRQLENSVQDLGGDGLVVDEMTLQMSERECPTTEKQHDHVAEATISGSAIAAFRTGPAGQSARKPLTIMSLGSRPRAELFDGGDAPKPPEPRAEAPDILPEGNRGDRAALRRANKARERDVFSNSRNHD
jgi:uncharacterized protein YbjQ (UPF0145 family)